MYNLSGLTRYLLPFDLLFDIAILRYSVKLLAETVQYVQKLCESSRCKVVKMLAPWVCDARSHQNINTHYLRESEAQMLHSLIILA